MTKEKINSKIEGLLCGCILPCGQDARPLPSPSILPGVEQTSMEQTDMEQTDMEQTDMEETDMEQTNMEQTGIEQTGIEQIGKEEIGTLHKSESRITSSSC